jgi:hypothetical protein
MPAQKWVRLLNEELEPWSRAPDLWSYRANGFSMRMPAMVWPAFRPSERIRTAPALLAAATISASQKLMHASSSMRKAAEVSAAVVFHAPGRVGVYDRPRRRSRERRGDLPGDVHIKLV